MPVDITAHSALSDAAAAMARRTSIGEIAETLRRTFDNVPPQDARALVDEMYEYAYGDAGEAMRQKYGRFAVRWAFWSLFYASAGGRQSRGIPVSELDLYAAYVRAISPHQYSQDKAAGLVASVYRSEASSTDLESWKFGHAMAAVTPLEPGNEASATIADRTAKALAALASYVDSPDEAYIRRGISDGVSLDGTSDLASVVTRIFGSYYTPEEERSSEEDRLIRAALVGRLAHAYVQGGTKGLRDAIDGEIAKLEKRATDMTVRRLETEGRAMGFSSLSSAISTVFGKLGHEERAELASAVSAYESARSALLSMLRTTREAVDDLYLARGEVRGDRRPVSPPPPPETAVACPEDILAAVISATEELIRARDNLMAARRIKERNQNVMPGLTLDDIDDRIELVRERIEENRAVIRHLLEDIRETDGQLEWTDPPQTVTYQTVTGPATHPVTVSGWTEVALSDLPDMPTPEDRDRVLRDRLERMDRALGRLAPKAYQASMANAAERMLGVIEGNAQLSTLYGSASAMRQMMDRAGTPSLFHASRSDEYRAWLIRLIRMSRLERAVLENAPVGAAAGGLDGLDIDSIRTGLRAVFESGCPRESELRRSFVAAMRRELVARQGWRSADNPNGVPPEAMLVWYELIGQPLARCVSDLEVELDPPPPDSTFWVPTEIFDQPGIVRQAIDAPETVISQNEEGRSFISIGFLQEPVSCGVSVVDGDTVYALVPVTVRDKQANKEWEACARMRVRLKGYDAAELGGTAGEKAKDFLDRLVSASTDAVIVLDRKMPVQPSGRGGGGRTIGSLVLEVPKDAVPGLPKEAILGPSTTDGRYVLVDAGRAVAANTSWSVPRPEPTLDLGDSGVEKVRKAVEPGPAAATPPTAQEIKVDATTPIQLFPRRGK